jgi:uncharacterized Fe-S center protein
MKSPVYFVPVQESDEISVVQAKLNNLLDKSRVLNCVSSNDNAVIKLHFGESGNTGHVRPEYVRVLSDSIVSKGAVAILSDTNTLYRGRRVNSVDHEKLAREHGFSPEISGGRVVVPDETNKDNCVSVPVKGKFIKNASILKLYKQADSFISVGHFKGHMMTGFGGALKNIGMGCASREGKLAQHSGVSPIVSIKKCTGCGACEKVCPVDAISIVEKKSVINKKTCIGCASCIAACEYGAMDVNWGSGASTMVEKMVEYAKAVLDGMKKTAYINFALKITAECDCMAKDDPRITQDVGIFASGDPVSLDQATYDVVFKKAGNKDVFKIAHPSCDSQKQLAYAEKLGLGTRAYELIEL